ncbi:putative glutathione-S-transferase [Pusillimonas sp. T7-7]|uniref:maleylacetoacetate isomerase n=1 Tax=Pusillimonas sp. (strain T7-7) TaxID=1007105 RepID=UPI000208519F|nr:maleylacetoacetate isomerase [Pusillimonas sp. T7-7]AEC20165.1 putative glutathione-S-transferase [Pusillimonas sp. T7-7]
MKLYGYFRSSAAYRVRIALNFKELAYETVSVHLLKDGGQQFADDYLSLNPTALVPTLLDGDLAIGQSMAIMEYLEETYPSPALLPADAQSRARVRAIAQTIACDIHPLNNLRVLKYLKHDMKLSEQDKDTWYRHWISVGLSGVEAMLANNTATGRFCHGDQPTLADLCLVPQLFNARRFGCDESAFPTVVRIDAACAELEAFRLAAPERQPDYVA